MGAVQNAQRGTRLLTKHKGPVSVAPLVNALPTMGFLDTTVTVTGLDSTLSVTVNGVVASLFSSQRIGVPT